GARRWFRKLEGRRVSTLRKPGAMSYRNCGFDPAQASEQGIKMSDFQTICRQLEQRLATPRHIPIERDRVPQAAVSLILSEARGSAQALIIKRAERPGDHWSGHLALPGGRAQAEDADLIATAARETYEEVGINLLDGGEFIGQLEILAPTNWRLP